MDQLQHCEKEVSVTLLDNEREYPVWRKVYSSTRLRKQTHIWIFDALVLNLVRDYDAIWWWWLIPP